MKITKEYTYKLKPAPDEIVGHFGPVKLVRKPNGLHQVAGGSIKQQEAVRNWCEHFAGDVVSFEDPKPVCPVCQQNCVAISLPAGDLQLVRGFEDNFRFVVIFGDGAADFDILIFEPLQIPELAGVVGKNNHRYR